MRKTLWWMLVALAALCAAAYSNTRYVPFIFDDIPAILKNPAIRQLWPLLDVTVSDYPALLGRPVVCLSLAINHAWGGYNVAGYHLFNLAVHILNAMLAFGVVRQTLGRMRLPGAPGNEISWGAWAVAVLWMLHPLATESVTYVLQRTELLMALFLLSTLYCFIRGIESTQRTLWFGLAVAACTLGMGTKEVMVVAPLLVLAYDYVFVGSTVREALRKRAGLYAGLAASWIVLAALQLTTNLKWKAGVSATPMGGWDYLLMQCGVVVHYLRLAVWPRGLVLDYSDWPTTRPLAGLLPRAALLLVLLGASVWSIRRRRWWGFWGIWFFLLLAPSSSFLPLPTEPAAERRMYLPLLAVIAVAVEVGRHLCDGLWARFRWSDPARKWLQTGVVLGLVLALSVATHQRNAQYHSAESIWADVIAKRPGNVRGHLNLGIALLDDGKATESIPQFMAALRLDPDQLLARCDLGAALAAGGTADESIARFRPARRVAFHDAAARAELGDALTNRNDWQTATEHNEALLASNADDTIAHFNLARLLTRAGRREEAVTQYREVLRLDPNDAGAHYNLANLLAESGRDIEAILQYAAAARLDPHDTRIQVNLGNAFLKQGCWDDAVIAYTDALRADPNTFEAHNNLAIALANRADFDHAAEHFREAARLRPDVSEVHSALADVLERLGQREEAQRERAEALRLHPTAGAHQP